MYVQAMSYRYVDTQYPSSGIQISRRFGVHYRQVEYLEISIGESHPGSTMWSRCVLFALFTNYSSIR